MDHTATVAQILTDYYRAFSTLEMLGIEVDDAVAIAEQVDV